MFAWEERRIQETKKRIRTETTRKIEGEGRERGVVRRWQSNGAVVPPNVFRGVGQRVTKAQDAAYHREVAEFARRYREQRAKPTAEEQFEMRAAFGPGVEVVDVFTGRRFRT